MRSVREHARQSGNIELAQLLEKTTREELGEHFTEEVGLAGLVGVMQKTSKTLFSGTRRQLKPLYRDFAFTEGNKAVEDRFDDSPQRNKASGRIQRFLRS